MPKKCGCQKGGSLASNDVMQHVTGDAYWRVSSGLPEQAGGALRRRSTRGGSNNTNLRSDALAVAVSDFVSEMPTMPNHSTLLGGKKPKAKKPAAKKAKKPSKKAASKK